MWELTPTQLQRNFKIRASATLEAKAALRREYLSDLRLEQILRKKALREHAAKDQKLILELDAQIRQETALLSAELVKHGLWLGAPVASTESIQSRLLQCERAILNDIKLLATLAKRQRDRRIEKRLQGFAQSKLADIKRIKNLPKDLR